MTYPPLPISSYAQGVIPTLSNPLTADAPNADAVRFQHLCGMIIWSNCGIALPVPTPGNDNRRDMQQRPAAAIPGAPWSSSY